jgi:hypothetical protein
MALDANSYGDTSEIAAQVPKHAGTAGTFSTTTRPTLLGLESIVDQLSAIINAMLADAGFQIPISQADAKLMLDMFVNQEAAEIVRGINGYGRFGPTPGKQKPIGWWAVMSGDVEAFINKFMAGIERLGATRTYSQTAGLATRGTDERGNDTFPIFQRDGFGNVFTDWDSS